MRRSSAPFFVAFVAIGGLLSSGCAGCGKEKADEQAGETTGEKGVSLSGSAAHDPSKMIRVPGLKVMRAADGGLIVQRRDGGPVTPHASAAGSASAPSPVPAPAPSP